jgi:antitoxin FitA
MANITVNNIPDDLYDRLKQLAEANRRSISSEVIVCIEKTVGRPSFDPREFLAEARHLRQRVSNYVISDEALNEAKRVDRQ